MIIRARFVVSMEGEPIENGAVAVEGDQIVGVGPFGAMNADRQTEILDLGEQILLPGLINAHCHLDYTTLRGKIPPSDSFSNWIRAINAEKEKLTPKDYLASINEGFVEAQRFGTTTLINLTAFPELISEIEEPIRTWWFGELIDVRNPERTDTMVDRAVESLKSATNWGLAPHAPFTVSGHLYKRCAEIAGREKVLLTTHLAESREEMQMFRDASGPAFEFLQSIGRPMDDCGDKTPLATLTQTGVLDENWIIAHLNELSEGDFDLLACGPKFHIAHCPRSHAFFGHTPFALQRLRALGFNICLGTDSLASNSSLSLFSEMRELLRKEPSISPREVVELATVNGARAVGHANRLGKIHAGFMADLIALPTAPAKEDVFDAIVAFEGAPPWLMVDGEPFSPS